MARDQRNGPVAITGLGFVGAVGRGVAALDHSLAHTVSGLKRLSLWPSELAGEFPVGQYDGDLPTSRGPESRSDQLARAAAREAMATAGLDRPELLAARAGIYLGTSVCGTFNSEAAYLDYADARRLDRRALLSHEAGATVDLLAREFSLPGPCTSILTACSSSANAIGLAMRCITEGRAQVMLAGGADSLSRITVNGFHSLQLLSPDGPRPFDRERQGMSVGEGAAILILESLEHAQRRGAEVLALLSGYGHSCDAHHLTAPHPEGVGAEHSMRAALVDAGLEPAGIGYINAHGTATPDNDLTEAKAIRRVFGDETVPVSSTKRLFGHTLGAAGGIEAAVCVRALQLGLLPANAGLREPMEDSGLQLLREPREMRVDNVLSNSFGFGGNNATLVFSRGAP